MPGPASGPLHMLVPLPEMLFLQMSTWLDPSHPLGFVPLLAISSTVGGEVRSLILFTVSPQCLPVQALPKYIVKGGGMERRWGQAEGSPRTWLAGA